MVIDNEYKIMIVDDEKEICVALQAMLEFNNYTVEIFYTAESAHNRLLEKPDNLPDIIITDYQMKGETGLDLLAKVKDMHPEISVVIMTGFGDKKLAVKSMVLGAENFLDKPLTSQKVQQTISEIIEKKMSIYQVMKQKNSAIIHEINNHLTVLKGNTQLLKFAGENNLTTLNSIILQINSMACTVKTMLTPENFINSSIKLQKKETNLKTVIENVISLLHNNAVEKNIKIESELADIKVLIDVNYLRQAIMNILLYAIMDSPESAKISVRVIIKSTEVCIEIGDEGIGIHDGLKSKIFNYGFRMNNDIKGYGIGLFFAQNVLKAHNGRIEVINNQPKGSVFRLMLKLIEN